MPHTEQSLMQQGGKFLDLFRLSVSRLLEAFDFCADLSIGVYNTGYGFYNTDLTLPAGSHICSRFRETLFFPHLLGLYGTHFHPRTYMAVTGQRKQQKASYYFLITGLSKRSIRSLPGLERLSHETKNNNPGCTAGN